MKVLIVDDSAENRYLIEVALSSHGYEVWSAADGLQALDKLKAGPVDLILSDILMPKMDGYALCRECKRNGALKDIPFVLATAAYTDEKDEAFALSVGADRFIRRPMEPEAMVAVVDEVLAKRRAGAASPPAPPPEEARYLTEYSERLFTQLERKVTELEKENARRRRVERALRTVSHGNEALLHASDEKGLLEEMCRTVVEVGGFRLAWAGLVETEEQEIIKVVARCSGGAGRPECLGIDWPDSQASQMPAIIAIGTGDPLVIQDIAVNEFAEPWRAEALRRGYASCIILPLSSDLGAFGALAIYAREPDAFDAEEVGLLTELAGDLGYGITALRTRIQRDHAIEERQRYLNKIRTKLEDTIQAIAALVEMRDPYTAGHERRVANLAAAIAREMGLEDDRIDGLHVAGSVHDVGKIRVPAEILTRPGMLATTELNLVQIHAEVGYEILRGIDFPWPVATMVLQHHERLDGSGYPNHLKDGAIILEAQILAVADTVEAMATNRPYRPAPGLEAALDVIMQKRGTHFRADVVDACVSLFRDGRFHFA